MNLSRKTIALRMSDTGLSYYITIIDDDGLYLKNERNVLLSSDQLLTRAVWVSGAQTESSAIRYLVQDGCGL
jgi:hypothetical protein